MSVKSDYINAKINFNQANKIAKAYEATVDHLYDVDEQAWLEAIDNGPSDLEEALQLRRAETALIDWAIEQLENLLLSNKEREAILIARDAANRNNVIRHKVIRAALKVK